eukprot:CAMPEP_0177781004 /NCGR_PEP_ID=MMETSP0491_2-20121128/17574_1 /TAXON_ID=63592 /ORGANISM="Tetraselmis chuii, Strain PLY429" /LENGTH=61 /DNA_ID=CAMNT_0019300951 /DNA_START=125 /DNA_END=311 /DNA_ORIENTATION=-
MVVALLCGGAMCSRELTGGDNDDISMEGGLLVAVQEVGAKYTDEEVPDIVGGEPPDEHIDP